MRSLPSQFPMPTVFCRNRRTLASSLNLLQPARMRADRIGLEVRKQGVDHILYLGPCIRTAVGLDGEPAFEAQLLRKLDCGWEVGSRAVVDVLDGARERIQKAQPLYRSDLGIGISFAAFYQLHQLLQPLSTWLENDGDTFRLAVVDQGF